MDQIGLVERAQQGDRHAFAELARASGARLDATARLILRDPELAQDAVQETLIRAWRSLPGLRDPASFDHWLHSLVVQACIDLIRRRKRRVIEVECRAHPRIPDARRHRPRSPIATSSTGRSRVSSRRPGPSSSSTSISISRPWRRLGWANQDWSRERDPARSRRLTGRRRMRRRPRAAGAFARPAAISTRRQAAGSQRWRRRARSGCTRPRSRLTRSTTIPRSVLAMRNADAARRRARSGAEQGRGSSSARDPVDLEAGRSRGQAELVVVRREHKSLDAVAGQEGARQVDGVQ